MELRSRYTGEYLKELIPQREPILMVDDFSPLSENAADSALTIKADNFFCLENKLAEPGLIEHIAQSASALSGFNALKLKKDPAIGYIGDVKKCTIAQLPAAGNTIRTHIEILSETMGISLLQAETRNENGELVCACSMKISVK